MEHDQHQLQDTHSPRQKFELTDELGHLQANEANVLFQQGDNPFSYYNQDNKRESVSSEDQAAEEHHQPTHVPTITVQSNHTASQEYKQIQISQNIGNKAPIKLIPSPKANGSSNKIQKVSSPKANIKNLKQSEFVVSTLSKQIKANDVSQVGISNKLHNSPNIKGSPTAQKKYEQELHNDLQDLKNSMKGKQAKKKPKIFDAKQQNSPKPNFNKTYAPTSKARYDNEDDMQMQEMRMLVKMAFEKKKANYEMLKEWDMKRAENMALHGKMIEMLQNQIDLRIKSSLENFQNYQTFFKEKARQQQKYVTSPVINTRFALQNNSLSKNVYINCSVILNSLCDQNTNRCKKINDFIHLIRTNILKELTETHLNSSQKQLLKVREKISTLKSSLKKYNQQTEEKTMELANLFKDQSNNITNKCDKDFYRTQLSFLRKAIHQIEVQKKLGEYCLEYYHTAVQQELKRSSVIREAMMTYSQGLKGAYNIQIEGIEVQQMSKNEELKLIEEYYSLEDMFDERTIEIFKIKNHIQGDITIQPFTKYINAFNYEPFDSRIILLKEFYVKQGKGKQEEVCYLVITVDNFLHLSFNCNRNIGHKPDITIKIGHKWLQIKALKDQSIEIVKKQQKKNSMMSYFWDNKMDKIYRIKFNKKDNKQEFIDYITKLMVDY